MPGQWPTRLREPDARRVAMQGPGTPSLEPPQASNRAGNIILRTRRPHGAVIAAEEPSVRLVFSGAEAGRHAGAVAEAAPHVGAVVEEAPHVGAVAEAAPHVGAVVEVAPHAGAVAEAAPHAGAAE